MTRPRLGVRLGSWNCICSAAFIVISFGGDDEDPSMNLVYDLHFFLLVLSLYDTSVFWGRVVCATSGSKTNISYSLMSPRKGGCGCGTIVSPVSLIAHPKLKKEYVRVPHRVLHSLPLRQGESRAQPALLLLLLLLFIFRRWCLVIILQPAAMPYRDVRYTPPW